MAEPEEIAELKDALARIAEIAFAAKTGKNENALVAALNEIADIIDEILCDDEEEEEGEGEAEEEEET